MPSMATLLLDHASPCSRIVSRAPSGGEKRRAETVRVMARPAGTSKPASGSGRGQARKTLRSVPAWGAGPGSTRRMSPSGSGMCWIWKSPCTATAWRGGAAVASSAAGMMSGPFHWRGRWIAVPAGWPVCWARTGTGPWPAHPRASRPRSRATSQRGRCEVCMSPSVGVVVVLAHLPQMCATQPGFAGNRAGSHPLGR
ncbi:MAG: hypothetical protein KatS3mg050_2815 [Litorilinea sp.]|nr:MAG: hypothetical protein KatS3mg050_2815 [Litorilinea sp.]